MFDQHCFDLAEVFLHDEPQLKNKCNELAQAIQGFIEGWIESERTCAELNQRQLQTLRREERER